MIEIFNKLWTLWKNNYKDTFRLGKFGVCLWPELIKRVFNYCQTSVLSLSTMGSLVDHRAYKPYTLEGPPVWQPVLAPLALRQPTIYARESFEQVMKIIIPLRAKQIEK